MSLASKILNEVNADETLEEIKKAPKKFFDSLRKKSKKDLKKLGCQAWDDPDEEGKVLMLFPYEWYQYIPKEYEVVDINNDVSKFPKGCHKDHRFGALAFGIRVKK